MLIKQILKKINLTCFDIKKDLYINKFYSIIKINIFKNVKITKINFKNMPANFSD